MAHSALGAGVLLGCCSPFKPGLQGFDLDTDPFIASIQEDIDISP